MNKRAIFEHCLYMTVSRFKYKERMEWLENKYEDAQHDDELLQVTISDFMSAMERIGVIDKELEEKV